MKWEWIGSRNKGEIGEKLWPRCKIKTEEMAKFNCISPCNLCIIEGEQTINRIYYVRKKFTFNTRKLSFES